MADKHKSKRKTSYFLRFLTALSLISAVVCAFGIGMELYTSRQGRSFYTALSAIAEKRPGSPQGVTAVNDDVTASETEVAWTPYLDFSAAKELVPDIVAWIRLEGTVIDYPVVRGTDNDYYLNHLPDKQSNKMGSIFLDYRNSADFSDRNSAMYGHHMKTGDMFSALEYYKEQSFYDAHPLIELYTPEKDYLVEIFAGCVISGAIETLPLEFEETSDFDAYIQELRMNSVFESDVDVKTDDRLITLCTCTYNFSNARFLIVGKLTEVSE